jgi:hypothetical protein
VISKKNQIYQFHSVILTFVCIFSSLVYANFAAFKHDVEHHADSDNPDELEPYSIKGDMLEFWNKFIPFVEIYMLIDFIV